MMKKHVLAVALVIAAWTTPATAQHEPLEFRGTPLGATEAEFVGKMPYFQCVDAVGWQKEQADQVCIVDPANNEAMIYANHRAKKIEAHFIDGKFVRVETTFEVPPTAGMWDPQTAITEILESRYGRAKLLADAYAWYLGSGTILAFKIVGTFGFRSKYLVSFSVPNYHEILSERAVPRLNQESKGM